jgi:nucleotide-binding universal stress UspA family protein
MPGTAAPPLVVGYDGSAAAREAVGHAVAIARGRPLVIVYAYEAAPPQLAERWRGMLDREHEAEGRAVLDAILLEDNGELAGADYETRLVPGRPADALLAVAEEVGADSILVGSHGYGRMSALLGSVSHELLQRSDRPVTVIPPRCAERLAAGRGVAPSPPG